MSIDKSKIYTTVLDEVYNEMSCTQDWENVQGIQILGGNTVSIPTISTTGNRTYDRVNGYTRSAGGLTRKDYSFDYERSFEYLVDEMDKDETGGVYDANNVLTNHVSNNEVPEVDTFRFAKVFQSLVNDATAKFGYYTPIVGTVYSTFMADLKNIRATKGHVPLRCKMTETAFAVMSASTEVNKQIMLQVGEGENAINTESYKINGVVIDVVPDRRMVTEMELLEPGYGLLPWTQQMNWLIYGVNAIVAAKKRNAVKTFANGSHPNGDGELLQGRMVQGAWLLEHQKDLVYVSLLDSTVAGFSATELKSTGATNITYTIADYATREAGHKYYGLTAGSATALAVPKTYDKLVTTAYTEITSAVAVAVTVSSKDYGAVVEVDENGRVVRFAQLKTA